MRPLVSPRNGLWLLVLVSLAFNVGFGTTFGVRTYRHYCRAGGDGNGNARRSLQEALNLSPEQTAQMDDARAKLLLQVDELRQQLSVEREALAELVTAGEPDSAAMATQLDSVASLRREIQRRVLEHLLEMKKLLRPEQREAFDEVIRRHIFPRNGHGHASTSGAHGSGSRCWAGEARRTSEADNG